MGTVIRMAICIVASGAFLLDAVSQEQRQGSVEKERALGRQLGSEIEQRTPPIGDAAVVSYVSRVAGKLTESCRPGVPIEVRVIEADQMNGFALPGGYLYLNTGAISNANSEAELAGILAHLIAHTRAGGSLRSRGVTVVGSWLGYSFQPSGSGQAGPLSWAQDNRNLVLEADQAALRCLSDAGYFPWGLVQVLSNPSMMTASSSSHPPPAERLQILKAATAKLELRSGYITDTPEFREIKKLVGHLHQGQPSRAKAPPSLLRK